MPNDYYTNIRLFKIFLSLTVLLLLVFDALMALVALVGLVVWGAAGILGFSVSFFPQVLYVAGVAVFSLLPLTKLFRDSVKGIHD